MLKLLFAAHCRDVYGITICKDYCYLFNSEILFTFEISHQQHFARIYYHNCVYPRKWSV